MDESLWEAYKTTTAARIIDAEIEALRRRVERKELRIHAVTADRMRYYHKENHARAIMDHAAQLGKLHAQIEMLRDLNMTFYEAYKVRGKNTTSSVD